MIHHASDSVPETTVRSMTVGSAMVLSINSSANSRSNPVYVFSISESVGPFLVFFFGLRISELGVSAGAPPLDLLRGLLEARDDVDLRPRPG